MMMDGAGGANLADKKPPFKRNSYHVAIAYHIQMQNQKKADSRGEDMAASYAGQ